MTSTSRASDVVAISHNNENDITSLASGDISMETNSVNVNLSRNVHDHEDESQDRNVRRNINIFRNNGQGIYSKKVDLDIDEVKMCQGDTAGVMRRRPFNPGGQLIPLEELIVNGSKFGRNLVLIILSISATTTDNTTMYQQRSKGVRGNNGTIRHNRNMVVMCPLSKAGSNTAIILFGAGCCKRLLDGDISLRDNGELCEYKTFNSYYINYVLLIQHYIQ